MAVDFLHPLCYRKGGTIHKIFGHTVKTELFDTSRALAVKTSDGIRYFNAVNVSDTQPVLDSTGLQLSSLRDFKTTKNNIYSAVGCIIVSVIKVGSGVTTRWQANISIVGNVTFQQSLTVTGTFGSYTFNASISSGSTSSTFVTSFVSISADLTFTLNGTSYSKTLQKTYTSSSIDSITLTDTVSP